MTRGLQDLQMRCSGFWVCFCLFFLCLLLSLSQAVHGQTNVCLEESEKSVLVVLSVSNSWTDRQTVRWLWRGWFPHEKVRQIGEVESIWLNNVSENSRWIEGKRTSLSRACDISLDSFGISCSRLCIKKASRSLIQPKCNWHKQFFLSKNACESFLMTVAIWQPGVLT